VPAMVRRGQGVIVNFSSGWGRSTDAGVAPYCATKWAIEGLTQALAQELPPGMAAVPLNPGIINRTRELPMNLKAMLVLRKPALTPALYPRRGRNDCHV